MVHYVFERFEQKYLLSKEQYNLVTEEIQKHLVPDEYGKTTIQSLYYDTDDYRLIRASLERPIYKEKLRLRCYGLNDSNKNVFLEMKRKYDGVVYKRRICCKEDEVSKQIINPPSSSQINKEIAYFFQQYPSLSPKVLILYDRVAYLDTESDLRITFDHNIRYRTDNLNCSTSLDGIPLISEEMVLLEIKTGMAYPLWLCKLLSREKIHKTSFSKYGSAYEKEYYQRKQGVLTHV